MKNTIRILIFTLILSLLLVVSAIAIGLYNPRVYEDLANNYVYKKTGYQYSTSDLSIQFSPTIITIEGLELINPAWDPKSKLFTLQNAEIFLDIKQLFNSQIPFWNAVLNDLDVQLIENDKKYFNWNTSILANQSKPDTKKPLALKDLLNFSEISINQAKIHQQKTDVNEEVNISSLLIKRTSDVSVQLEGAGEYQKQAVDISGKIEFDEQDSAAEILRFAMQARGLGIDLQSSGEINPGNLDGTKLSLKVKSDSLEKLETFLETTIPAVAPVEASLELLSSNGNYEASKINLTFGENNLTGDVSYNAKDSHVGVNLISEKLDLSQLVLEEKNEETKAKDNAIYQEAEIDWSWMRTINTDINLDFGEIVVNEHSLSDISAKLKLNNNILDVEKFNAKYSHQGADEPKKFFSSDLIKISGTVKPLADKTIGEDVQLAVNITDLNSSLSLTGDANLNGIKGSALKIHADTTNLDALSEYLQSDFSPYLPMKIDADIETFQHAINVSQLVLRASESDIVGNVNLNWSNDIVKVEGKIGSSLLDLSPMLSSEKNEKKVHKEKIKDKVFADEPINWQWLEIYDADLDLDIQKLIINDNVFNKVKSKLAIGNGSLNIQPLQAHFANGNLKSELTLRKTGDQVKLNTQLDAINLSLAAIGATDGSVLEGGTTDILMNIGGQGNSLHQIASSLNGELVAEVQKGVIKNDAFEAIGTDIVLEMLTMLNPFMKEDETTELECAAVRFVAKDGILTSKNQMAVETSKMKIVGGGIIDLGTEELEIGFSPSAKKGVGVNIGSLVKFVRLGGTLKNPHPEADPVGLLKSGAAIGAAVSTGGLSLLVEGLFKRATSSGSACNQALSEVVEQDGTREVLNKSEEP